MFLLKKQIRTLLALFLMFLAPALSAQKHEASVFVDLGTTTLAGFYGGFRGFYTHRFSPRFELKGGFNTNSHRKYFFNGVMADAIVNFYPGKTRILLSNRVVYNNYSEFNFHELIYRISGKWATRYVDLEIGNSFIYAASMGDGFWEWLQPTFGATVRLRPLENRWNASLAIRNYDDFIYENFNLFLELGGSYRINDNWSVLANVTAAPAGSLSQLATQYRVFTKFGATYKW